MQDSLSEDLNYLLASLELERSSPLPSPQQAPISLAARLVMIT